MELQTEPVILNLGPHHPSTHGVFRIIVSLDGEVITDAQIVLGYLHRGMEKLAEERTYTQNIPLTDRMDYLASMSNNLAYVLAVEKLGGIEVPERASYLRVIMAELQRLGSHAMALGSFADDCGTSGTPLLYAFREREKIVDLFEMVSGQRLTYNYMRVGGVAQDVPEEFLPALKRFVDEMPGYIDEYEQLLVENEILLARTKGVGVLTAAQAINASASGPILRASGIRWDLRKADPYCVYDRMEFDIPTGENGDCYDRFMVRLKEMRQSVRIIKQAMELLPGGEVRTKMPLNYRPPVGEAYGHIEAPKGELGFYLVSDGTIKPYRWKVRSPSYINLNVLRDLLIGWKVADVIIITGSLDFVMGEVDR